MRILHSEASSGWGGQEIRILEEALGMRERGHELFFVVQKGGGLVVPLRKAGFTVYELSFTRPRFLLLLGQVARLVRRHQIEIINTHSSLDSWIGGFVGWCMRRKVIRTRHLSTAIRGGINGRVLYNCLVSHVVTTCAEVVPMVQERSKISKARITSIPTGINPKKMQLDRRESQVLRERFGIGREEIVVGTTCIFRGWKGIEELLHAAKLLERERHIKFMIVGSGISEPLFRELHRKLGLEKSVFFTGYQSPPFSAIAAMDIFALLSRANEGVSQASLQAAYLEKPLITTTVGGLKEVCLHEKTGLIVPIKSPEEVSQAILKLATNFPLRESYGKSAKELVEREFLFETMLDKMERVYGGC